MADARNIYNNGKSFLNSSFVLMKPTPISHDRVIMYAVPAIVNAVFSVELFIKSLYKLENGSDCKGHNLKQLIELLNEGTRDDIYNAVILDVGTTKEEINAFIEE